MQSAIARRLYRFLDKRFFRRDRWEFDLKEFACEHAGLSAPTTTPISTQTERWDQRIGTARLSAGVVGAGTFPGKCGVEWRVVFEKAKGEVNGEAAQPGEPAAALVAALIARGVSTSTARSTVKQYPATRIQPQLEVFDYLVAQK